MASSRLSERAAERTKPSVVPSGIPAGGRERERPRGALDGAPAGSQGLRTHSEGWARHHAKSAARSASWATACASRSPCVHHIAARPCSRRHRYRPTAFMGADATDQARSSGTPRAARGRSRARFDVGAGRTAVGRGNRVGGEEAHVEIDPVDHAARHGSRRSNIVAIGRARPGRRRRRSSRRDRAAAGRGGDRRRTGA